MRIGKVIGKVTLNRVHPSLRGGSFRLVIPLKSEELNMDEMPGGEELVLYDEHGSGEGDQVAFSEGGEAAQPFLPVDKPVDAYCAAILDRINIDSVHIKKKK